MSKDYRVNTFGLTDEKTRLWKKASQPERMSYT